MQNWIKLPCALSMMTALGACLGGGDSGSGNAGPDTFARHLEGSIALSDRLDPLLPTEALAESGTATYRGFAGFVSSSDPIEDVPIDEFNVEILSRLTMTADFGTGAIDGRMTDFFESDLGPLQGQLDITGEIVPEGFEGSTSGTLVFAGPSGDVPAVWQSDMLGSFLGDNAEAVEGDMVGTATFPGDQIIYVYGILGGTQ